jgi:hypothetical protein
MCRLRWGADFIQCTLKCLEEFVANSTRYVYFFRHGPTSVYSPHFRNSLYIFFSFLSLLSKSRLMRSLACLCVCVSPLSTVECLNQYLWNLVCISWKLSSSQQRTVCLSVCLYVYPSYLCKATAQLNASLISVLGNGSVNMFPRQRIHVTVEMLDVSFAARSMSYQMRVCRSVFVLSYRF